MRKSSLNKIKSPDYHRGFFFMEKIVIIGGGAFGLWCAYLLKKKGYSPIIFDQNKRLGAKLLVAGKGGFNLSRHPEALDYSLLGNSASFLKQLYSNYSPLHFADDLTELGFPIYYGSSSKMFPKDTKPSLLVNSLIAQLKKEDVKLKHQLIGLSPKENTAIFTKNTGEKIIYKYDHLIMGLGSKSWPITGSDGKWLPLIQDTFQWDLPPFQAANCRIYFDTNFLEFAQEMEGNPLKNLVFMGGEMEITKGEAVILKNGMEGNAVYPLIPILRRQLQKTGEAHFSINLKPRLSSEQWEHHLKTKGKKSWSKLLLSVKIPKEIHPLFHYNRLVNKTESLLVKIPISGFGSVEESISNSGGIPLSHLTSDLAHPTYPNHYFGGEMLDWEAPTGGYLLQACFSMAHKVVDKISKNLETI
ncbi:MAG: putative Rossmann fold flavoprotein [Sphingobacteriales bacterium]